MRSFAPAEERAGAPTIQLFYARPADVVPDRARMGALIQDVVRYSEEDILEASGGRKGIRVRTGAGACSSSHVDIVEIVLGPQAGYPDLATVYAELRQRIGRTPFITWAGVTEIGCCGRGGSSALFQPTPISPAQDRALNGSGLALTGGFDFPDNLVFTHELFHALGAVGRNAPHGDDQGHIAEGDLMDPFGTGSIDPGRDDYFNPDGPIIGRDGSRLWNIYDSLFLCPAESCRNPPAPPAVRLEATAVSTSAWTVRASGATHYRWYVDGNLREDLAGPDASSARDPWWPVRITVRGFAADGSISEPIEVIIPAVRDETAPGGNPFPGPVNEGPLLPPPVVSEPAPKTPAPPAAGTPLSPPRAFTVRPRILSARAYGRTLKVRIRSGNGRRLNVILVGQGRRISLASTRAGRPRTITITYRRPARVRPGRYVLEVRAPGQPRAVVRQAVWLR
ncbi:hypothetical protein [Miltoncostaea oceani]|uniref:hypothetical protein n=1 Tax=Miltoncostaea oceani TaxID=2843216 RepID=UPI001C3D82CB|nr:hypothetical protein [Miltoncostaea oceani]